MKRLQAELVAELYTQLPTILDRAFKENYDTRRHYS
jgi:hypothetical protein